MFLLIAVPTNVHFVYILIVISILFYSPNLNADFEADLRIY